MYAPPLSAEDPGNEIREATIANNSKNCQAKDLAQTLEESKVRLEFRKVLL